MPKENKSNTGSGKVKDLKPRKLASSKAEDVKGGGGDPIITQSRMNDIQTANATMTNASKTLRDTSTSIISNLKA